MPTCSICSRSFSTSISLQQHRRSSPKSHQISKCKPCNRSFVDQHALQQHLLSPVHSKTQCLGSGCLRQFKTWSGMIQHWESGACRSGMRRNLVNNIATSLDTSGFFSTGGGVYTLPSAEAVPRVFEVDSDSEGGLDMTQDTQLLQTTPAADTSASSVDILTPDTTSGSHHGFSFHHSNPGSVIFTPQSTGTTKSCSIIFTPKTPTTLPGLNKGIDPRQLANSLEGLLPRIIEIPPMYFCPNGWCQARAKTFSSLSGLFQHLESGRCGGAGELRRRLVGRLKSIRW